MKHVRALVFVTLAWLSSASAVCAQTGAAATSEAANPAPAADEEARRNEAKERFLRGLELAAQDNWDAALVEFLASRELFPTRVALSNIPISLRHLKRYAEAIDAYAELDQKFGSALTPEDRKRMETAVAELRTFVGELEVTSDQPGSTVVIDGQQRGTTPLPAPLMVNAGTHSVRVSREGFESFETQLPVAGKQRKAVAARLRPLSKSGVLIVREAGN
jgi:tetratricopeptide (TPR) repeat protein